MVVSTKLDIAVKRAFKGSAWIVCKILPECECKLQTQKGSNRVIHMFFNHFVSLCYLKLILSCNFAYCMTYSNLMKNPEQLIGVPPIQLEVKPFQV